MSAICSIYKFPLSSPILKQDKYKVIWIKTFDKTLMWKCDLEFDILLVAEDFVLKELCAVLLDLPYQLSTEEKIPNLALIRRSIPTARHCREAWEQETTIIT